MRKAHGSHPGLGMGGTNGTSETVPTRPSALTSPTLPAALGAIASQLTRIADVLEALATDKEEKGKIPHTPLKEKGESNNNSRTRAREKFVKPTVEKVEREGGAA